MSQNKVDLIFLKSIFHDHLLRGDPSVITDINIRALNIIAMRIYNEISLDDNGIECLKYILLICNVLYNRTDMEVLPIEDGVYDLLLEKYKVFDQNFQVGSAVVEFKSTIKREPDYKEPVCPIVLFEKREINDPVSKYVRDNIMREGQPILNSMDLHTSPLVFNNNIISKRTHNTEHNHPSLVGTLDKCKFVLIEDAIKMGAIDDPNVKILERDFFMEHLKSGIISSDQELSMVLELKYDGVSVEADCTNVLLSARTRGDTGIGVAADITPILEGYSFKHARSMIGHKPIGVKFEAIMTRTALFEFCKARECNYANCRTAIVGLFTSSDAYLYRDYITLIPLAVDRNDVPQIQNREIEIEFLNEVFRSHGEPLRYCIIKGNITQCLFYIKKFLEEAKAAREYLDFMYDGIVVSYLDEDIREKLGRENYINKYSMAVKFDPLCKTTTFRGYTYEVGQNGNITPMIHYDPVEFYGTIHTKCTGSSLFRFNELSLKYGDRIDVTYVNDVMPYVTKPDCEYNRNNTNPVLEPPTHCPVCGNQLSISESGKSLICTNWYCSGRQISRMSNMLAKMNLKGFGDQMIIAIDKYDLRSLMNLDMNYLSDKIGEGNAKNFLDLIERLKTEPIYDYIIIGSLGFTGVASKKWKNIFAHTTIPGLIKLYESGMLLDFLRNCKIGPITSETIDNEMEFFIDDIKYISSNMNNVVDSYNMKTGKQIRFSGCRDLQLEKQLCNQGHDADSSSSVTKKTDILIIPYDGYSSTKTKKMSESGKIVTMSDFISNMNFYLS